MAYFLVHSLPVSLYLERSVLNCLAISGTNGSSGLGSVKSDEMDSNTEMTKMQKTLSTYYNNKMNYQGKAKQLKNKNKTKKKKLFLKKDIMHLNNPKIYNRHFT